MRPMMLDIVKLPPQPSLRRAQRTGQVVFEVADFRRVVESILNLAKDSRPTPVAVAAVRPFTRSPIPLFARFYNPNCRLPTAPASDLLRCARRRKQNLLMQRSE